MLSLTYHMKIEEKEGEREGEQVSGGGAGLWRVGSGSTTSGFN